MVQWTWHCTEVGRAFFNHFQKIFLNRVFIKIKIARKFKFYMWMIISGSKSVKKGQKLVKKARNWTYIWFFEKNLGLANLIHINSCNMRKKSVMLLYDFRTYFFQLGKLAASFSNLLSTVLNNFIKLKVIFFSKFITWHSPSTSCFGL